MASRPRNVRYFPRMKVRGARRRGQAPLQMMLLAVDSMTVFDTAFAKLSEQFKPIPERDFRHRECYPQPNEEG